MNIKPIKSYCRLLLILFLANNLFSCGKKHDSIDPYAPVYEGYSNDNVQHVQIRDSKFKNLYPEDYKHVCYTDNIECASRFAVELDDRLIAVSRDGKTISIKDLDSGKKLNKYNLVGRGPGEYQEIYSLVSDGSSLVAMDGPSFKIIRYDENLNYSDELFVTDLDIFSNIAFNYPYLVYTMRQNPEYLLRIINLSETEFEKEFHKRIISLGMEPTGYNRLIVSMPNHNEIAVLSGNLPILFIYKNIHNNETILPTQILRLYHEELNLIGKRVELNIDTPNRVIENPPLKEFVLSEGETVRLTPMFQSFAFDSDWIFIYQLPGRRLIVLENKGSHYEHFGSYRLIDENGNYMRLGNISYSYPWLYATTEIGIVKINKYNLN